MTPPTMAPMALMPSQSATRSSPGLPASASRFSVCWVNDVLAMPDMRPERRFMSGRSVRSASGAWSSSSSRFLACIVPSWLRRAWTGSTDGLLAESDEDQQDRAGCDRRHDQGQNAVHAPRPRCPRSSG